MPGTEPFIERRAEPSTCSLIDGIKKDLIIGDERMTRIEAKIDSNSADTAEVLDILHLGKSFFRILGIIGDVVKWAAFIVAPVAAAWYTFKNGGKP